MSKHYTRFTVYGLDCTIPFGKYKGETVKEIADKDKSYILWLKDGGVYFTPQVRTYVLTLLDCNATEILTNHKVFPLMLN